ncbi:MAG: hypothetical protein WB791_02900 [Waddliaceae bacterium]
MQQTSLWTIDDCIGKKQFVTIHQLIDLGLFRSYYCAKNALENGVMPFTRVGSRLLVHRDDLLKFLEENYFGDRN